MAKKLSKIQRQAVLDKLKAMFGDEELPACEFCGRVMLVGVCCDKSIQAIRKVKKHG